MKSFFSSLLGATLFVILLFSLVWSLKVQKWD